MVNWNDVIRQANHGNPEPPRKVIKTDEQWRAQLSEEQFRITRDKGTESRNSSPFCGLSEPGVYTCVCCETALFDSASKFGSRSGWPSFREPTRGDVVAYQKEGAATAARIEVTCNVCEAHLGHVFPDGPEPSGLRFCMNGVALDMLG